MQMSGMLEGVELGQFIMTTQRGRLFRGVYNGEPVTVKVSQYLPGWSDTENYCVLHVTHCSCVLRMVQHVTASVRMLPVKCCGTMPAL